MAYSIVFDAATGWVKGKYATCSLSEKRKKKTLNRFNFAVIVLSIRRPWNIIIDKRKELF